VNSSSTSRPILILWVLVGLLNFASANDVVFHNRGTTNNPQVDACVVINSGQWTVLSSQLYSTVNTRIFTNNQSGIMEFNPGVVFELITNNNRTFMDTFANFGRITASGIGRIDARATNIVAHGNISSSTAGRVRLEGRNIDVERGVLASVQGAAGTIYSIDDVRPTNYLNEVGIEDVYWSSSRGGRTSALPAIAIPFTFGSPFPDPLNGPLTTPFHEVTWPAFNSIAVLNSFGFTNYASFMLTNEVTPTNVLVQVVLVGTNSLAPNIGVDVRFWKGFGLSDPNSSSPIVRFSLSRSNFITSTVETNFLYFIDHSTSQTNISLSRNLNGKSFRPRSYALTKSSLVDFEFDFFSVSSNAIQQFDTFFPAGLNFTNQSTTNYRYSSYGVKIGRPSTNALEVLTNSSSANLSISDATNLPGRVEIFGDNVNLRLARLQAENTIIVTTTNLQNSEGARFEAPNLVFNVARENDTIVLTNFVPQSVEGFHGFMQAYSTIWTNTSIRPNQPNVQYVYQVTVVDASILGQEASVSIPTLNVRSTNIVVQNKLNAARSFLFDAPGLTFDTGTELRLDAATIPNLLPTNFPRLVNFTNRGIITVPGLADVVGGVGSSLSNYINDGILLSSILNVKAANFESAGTNAAFNFSSDQVPATFPLLSLESGGPLTIDAAAVKLQANVGAGQRGRQVAVGDITIRGNSLKIIGQDIMTPARFVMNVTNLVSDGGGVGSNSIVVGSGFSMLQKPTLGDILGTSLESVIPRDFVVDHFWTAENRGKSVTGYTNNMALGKLIINTTNSLGQPYLVRFFGTGTDNAMYVDLLDFRGSITNEDLGFHLDIADNLTIYFANASPSVEHVLAAVTNSSNTNLRQRLQWVSDFTGPNSSQIFSFIDSRGNVVQTVVNSAKFNSQILDSDGDGVVNSAEDELNSGTPFDGVLMRNNVSLTTNFFTNVTATTAVASASITWRAAAETLYSIEATDVITNQFSQITNLLNTNLSNGDITFTDTLPSNTTMRFYRIGYTP